MCECPACNHKLLCPECGYESEPEPTEEELEAQRYDDALHKHYKDEGYRRAYYKKKGWKFTPKPFKYDG